MTRENLKLQLQILGPEVVAELVRQLIDADKVATGDLLASVHYEILETADAVLLNILSNEYLKYVDEGRRPGAKWPPREPIRKWVEARGIVFRNQRGVKYTTDQTAFVIARSIGIKGIRPTNVKEKTIKNILSRAQELVSKGVTLDVLEYINEGILSN